jgi:hypothetical protein
MTGRRSCLKRLASRNPSTTQMISQPLLGGIPRCPGPTTSLRWFGLEHGEALDEHLESAFTPEPFTADPQVTEATVQCRLGFPVALTHDS